MNLKNGEVFTSKFVGTGPSSYEKKIYRAAVSHWFNPLTPNDPYSGRTAPLTSKLGIFIFIQQIYALNILKVQNAVCFIILTYLVPVLFTFYIEVVLKLRKIIPAP
jgi:hypothetical protein